MKNPGIILPGEWTLFLDRDGVINENLPGAYVNVWEEFRFIPGVLMAIPELNRLFRRTLIVTNQQGVGKGQITEGELLLIHEKMLAIIRSHGGQIDRVYHCPDLKDSRPNCRKPGTAMAENAKLDFPDIDFSKCLMVGDMNTDIAFGHRLGMMTAWIQEPGTRWEERDFRPDLCISGLAELVQLLTETKP